MGKPAVLATGLAVLAAVAAPAVAQRVPPVRPLTLVVGHPESAASAERVDGARSGSSSAALPEGALRVVWRRSAGPFIEHAPLVTREGDIVVFSGRGDLVELGADGVEKRRVAVGAGPLGPGAILADGTIVTMTTNGEAVGIKTDAQTARVRFRTRVGDRGVLVLVAPLALDDGGVVVANTLRTAVPAGSRTGPNPGGGAEALEAEIAALDADGYVRSKAIVPRAIVWPLVATRAGVAGLSADGTVFTWGGVGSEPVQVGSFGGALNGGAAALNPSTLVAVVDARSVVSLDVESGETKVLLATPAGGGVVLGPPSVAGGTTYVLEVTPTATRIVAIDGSGGVSFQVSGAPVGVETDGGVTPTLTPIDTAILVDPFGRVAFGGPDGHVGVVSSGVLAQLGDGVCGRGPSVATSGAVALLPAQAGHATRPSAGFAGLTPMGQGAFLVACEAGTLLKVTADH